MSVMDRIRPRITVDGECWLYNGNRNKYGYCRMRLDGKQPMVHRVTYELYRGVVPNGLELDHLCRIPWCCNPWHLEAVTRQENVRRYRALATHCPNGHPYGDTPPGERKCATCRRKSGRERQRRYYARTHNA